MPTAPVDQAEQVAARDAATAPREALTRDFSKLRASSGKALKSYDAAAELVAALLHGPKSTEEIAEVLGLTRQSTFRYVKAFRRSGVIYVTELRGHLNNNKGGRPVLIYAMQPAVFQNPDLEAL